LSVDVHSLVGVNVDQFFGIEIEEFPAQIAQVALKRIDGAHERGMALNRSLKYRLCWVDSADCVEASACGQVSGATLCSADNALPWGQISPSWCQRY
jgi:hypothetical protein